VARNGRAIAEDRISVPAARADELNAFYRVILNDERMPAVAKRSGG